MQIDKLTETEILRMLKHIGTAFKGASPAETDFLNSLCADLLDELAKRNDIPTRAKLANMPGGYFSAGESEGEQIARENGLRQRDVL